MVTYSLQLVCGGHTVTLIPQIIWWPYRIYASQTVISRLLARCKVIASLAIFFNFTLNFFRSRNATTTPQMHRKVIVQWPWGEICFLPGLRCLESLKAACGGRMVILRRLYGELVVAATTMRVPYGHHTVASRSPCSHLTVFDLINHTITLTTTTTANKTLWFLKITFTNLDCKTVQRNMVAARYVTNALAGIFFQVLLAQLSASYAPELKTIFA